MRTAHLVCSHPRPVPIYIYIYMRTAALQCRIHVWSLFDTMLEVLHQLRCAAVTQCRVHVVLWRAWRHRARHNVWRNCRRGGRKIASLFCFFLLFRGGGGSRRFSKLSFVAMAAHFFLHVLGIPMRYNLCVAHFARFSHLWPPKLFRLGLRSSTVI